MNLDAWRKEAEDIFSQSLGLESIQSEHENVADKPFLKFLVNRDAPVYAYALQNLQNNLSDENPFKGRIEIEVRKISGKFPTSIEAAILEGLIASSSRRISEGNPLSKLHESIKIVPFHNREENKIIQPATHLILGRRGVGKSTLISMTVETLKRRKNICVVLDLQSYSQRLDAKLIKDIYEDIAFQTARTLEEIGDSRSDKMFSLQSSIRDGKIDENQIILDFKRILKDITQTRGVDFFLFLDDFHLIHQDLQPKVLASLHGGLKGARGWLKVAGISTLVKSYDAAKRVGLQVPGDAQIISLDLTLTDPQAAESHLKLILENYLKLVGVPRLTAVIGEGPFKRLVWANAGVVRDFLQMFSLALADARRFSRSKIALSSVNVSIGELGKQKMSDLEQDIRNEADSLRDFLSKVEEFCLDKEKVNAFLVRQRVSKLHDLVQILADLRVAHLINQSITPRAAGERYEAYMLDYSLFTGQRRKRNIKEIYPKKGFQFKIKELRSLPALSQTLIPD